MTSKEEEENRTLPLVTAPYQILSAATTFFRSPTTLLAALFLSNRRGFLRALPSPKMKSRPVQKSLFQGFQQSVIQATTLETPEERARLELSWFHSGTPSLSLSLSY